MSLGLLLPGLIVVIVSTASGMVRWRLAPMAVARILTAIAAIAASTVLLVLFAAVGGLATQMPIVAQFVELCGVSPQHDVGVLEGGIASVLVVVIAVRACRVLQRRRLAVKGTQGRRFAILDTAEPIAYAAPGDPGCVVVSRGLLGDLDPGEREVVLAHERAHLRLNHHRYLLAGELSLAAVPLLGPLVDLLRLATERRAD
jgi:Zn-dependent protease with chaperone function